MRSRPEKPCPNAWKSGWVSRMIQVSERSSRMRMPIAPASPIVRAAVLLVFRQLADEDRDEDDVVDAKNDFEEGEGEQARSARRL